MSYTWYSIIASREIVKKGSIWWVGDRTSIHVWDDKWLPNVVHGILQSDWNQVIDHELLLANLIDH